MYVDLPVHHLLPITAEHLPYTRITATPATDEPAPSALTQPRLTAQLDWLHVGINTRTHLTGDGGDSIFSTAPLSR